MASGYGISADSKELLVVGGVIVVLVLIAWAIVAQQESDAVGAVGQSVANATDSISTAAGNIFKNLTGETAAQTETDDYNFIMGIND